MALTFSSLPPEIASYAISKVGDQNSLYSMLRCSRFAYDITLPLLYRDVEFWDQPRRARDENAPESACHEVHHGKPVCPQYWSVYSFANSVLGNARLAAYVRSFTFHGVICPGLDRMVHRRFSLAPNIRRAVECTKHSQGYLQSWLIALREGCNMDALIALLLPELPRLEKLDCAIPDSAVRTVEMLVTFAQEGKKFYRPTAFQNLKSVANHGSMDFTEKALFLRMPNI